MRKLVSFIAAAAVAAAAIPFGALSGSAATIKGDVNGDNKISLRDATLAQKINLGSKSPNGNERYSADFDSNSSVQLADVLLIQKYVCLDKTTIDEYSPNRKNRVEFLTYLNLDRQAAGLPEIQYNDAMLEAGNIRAAEYKERNDHYRANGSQFYTIFSECNINVDVGGALERGAHDVTGGRRYYNICKSENSPVYQYMMSYNCTVVCVGSIPDSTGSSMATWIIDVA